MKILLIGNPNVGKSAIFAHLTGINVTTSNYPGTTVQFTRGRMTYGGKIYEVIDVPGTYRLDPQSEAEKVAVNMIKTGDILVNVVDATNLERNLNLTLQLMEFGKPMVIALNMWDDTIHKGIGIDDKKLTELLGVPAVPTNGLTEEGLLRLRREAVNARPVTSTRFDSEQRWKSIGHITSQVQNLKNRRHTFVEKIQDLMIHPVAGFPLALLSLYLAFKLIIEAGEFITTYTLKLFHAVYLPFILWISELLGGQGIIHSLLIGDISGSAVDFEGAMGVLTTGVFVVFGIVLPFLVLFYLIFGFLEDLGYLPRVAVLFDRVLHYIGLHGYSVIPMLLACGCNVPGILAIRNLESRRERFITAVVTCVTIPCMAQTALIVRAVGVRGGQYTALVFTTLFMVWAVLGIILKRTVGGTTPTLLMEVPPYRIPGLKVQIKKLKMRLLCFLREAVPYVFGGILFINLLHTTGVIAFIGRIFAPVVKGVFGLPEETVSALIIGTMRKDAAIALLEPLTLDSRQVVTAVLVLTLYFPCIATFTVLLKELGVKDTVKAVAVMFAVTLVTGGMINLLLERVYSVGVMIAVEIAVIAIAAMVMPNIKGKNAIEKSL